LEAYHDTLYPELKQQPGLFDGSLSASSQPGNTIRKVYLCRAQSNLGPAGSLLLFYKGKSDGAPSQAITAVGIFEDCQIAHSTKDLMRMTGGRSVYSEDDLNAWEANPEKPVKVINYLLAGYINPPITIQELRKFGIFGGHPPQSIFRISSEHLALLLPRLKLGFDA
jgi:hypothetical protein